MWSNIVFGSALIGVALLMTFFQVRASRSLQSKRESTDEREYSYLRSRYRRHAITNLLIGLTGVAIIAASWVQTDSSLLYWGLVMLLVAAIVYSALVDVSATRAYFGDLRQDHRREREALEEELRRFQAENQDGASDDPAANP